MRKKTQPPPTTKDKDSLTSEEKNQKRCKSSHSSPADRCPDSMNYYFGETPVQVLLFSTTSYSMEYPFGQLGSPVLAMPTPNILHAPSLLTEKVLILCKYIYSPNTDVEHYLGHKPKSHHHMGCYEKNELHPKQTQDDWHISCQPTLSHRPFYQSLLDFPSLSVGNHP